MNNELLPKSEVDVNVQHRQLVEDCFKKPNADDRRFTELQYDLTHLALGVAGEAGEIVDVIKKHVIYNQPLNIEHLREELGDLEFYLTALYQAINTTRERVLHENIVKLRKRYPERYSDQAAKERKDKESSLDQVMDEINEAGLYWQQIPEEDSYFD